MELNGVGIWSSALRFGPPGEIPEAAAELDELGYSALWFPDLGGDLLGAAATLLAATRRAIVAKSDAPPVSSRTSSSKQCRRGESTGPERV